jgi:vacuolar protein sorting-associated protein 29
MIQGSITGAYSALTEKVTPSFILLAIQEAKLVCYVYELANGEVEVSKTEFTKAVTEGSSPALLQSLLS